MVHSASCSRIYVGAACVCGKVEVEKSILEYLTAQEQMAMHERMSFRYSFRAVPSLDLKVIVGAECSHVLWVCVIRGFWWRRTGLRFSGESIGGYATGRAWGSCFNNRQVSRC